MMCKIEPLNMSVGSMSLLEEGCVSYFSGFFFLLISQPLDVCKLLWDRCARQPDKIFAVSICCHIKT